MVSISTYLFGKKKKIYLNLCPELRMKPSAPFMSFMQLGNILDFFKSWVITEVIHEVVYILLLSLLALKGAGLEEKRDGPVAASGLE